VLNGTSGASFIGTSMGCRSMRTAALRPFTCWPAGPRMRSGIVVALPLTAMSSQYVIGSFEARFFARSKTGPVQIMGLAATRNGASFKCARSAARRG
jgi:hypothetical protein